MSEAEPTPATKAKKANGTAPSVKPEELTASNVFDNLDAIRRASPTDLITEKAEDVHLAVRKPRPREFFRVCDNPAMTSLLAIYIHKPEGSMDEETYFVLPTLEAYLRELEELRIVQVVLCRTLGGATFLWPLPTHDGEGKARDNVTSARSIAQAALTDWVRMKWRRADNAYFKITAETVHPEPTWPERPFNELLKLGFKDKVIDSRDHPVMQALRGIKARKAETSNASWLA